MSTSETNDQITPSPSQIPQRKWDFLMDRLRWLDQEITRYRDFEWKATSFHTAFFTALLYALLNKEWRPFLQDQRVWLASAVIIYLGIAFSQLIYIH
jgi:hypothetical protein